MGTPTPVFYSSVPDSPGSEVGHGHLGRLMRLFCQEHLFLPPLGELAPASPDLNRQESKFWATYCSIQWHEFGGTTVWAQNDVRFESSAIKTELQQPGGPTPAGCGSICQFIKCRDAKMTENVASILTWLSSY